MRIDEILDPLADLDRLMSHPWRHQAEVFDWLEANGFERIGYGNSSEIHTKPGLDRVVKVTYQHDPCWMRFADLTLRHPNPHFVRIDGIAGFTNVLDAPSTQSQQRHVVVMERLVPFPNEEWEAATGLRYWIALNVPRCKPLLPAERGLSRKRLGITAGTFEAEQPRLVEALRLVIADLGPCRADLHRDNFMKRGDTLVLADPLKV